VLEHLAHEFKHLAPADLVAVVEVDRHANKLPDDEFVHKLLLVVPLGAVEDDDQLVPLGLDEESECRHDRLEVGQAGVLDRAEVVEVNPGQE